MKKINVLKKILIMIFVTCPVVVFTEDMAEIKHDFGISIGFAYILPNHEGLDSNNGWAPINYNISEKPASFVNIADDEGRELGNEYGTPFIFASGTYSLIIPMLTGNGGLTEGNNLNISTTVSANPVSAGLDVTATLTVLPLLNFFAGSHIGTGWAIDDMAVGIGLDENSSGDPDYDSFQGIVNKYYFGGTFMFNLSPVLPQKSDWTNIIFSASAFFTYQYYSGASKGEAWIYGGPKNYNGWLFDSSFFLGYLIPKFPINMIGVGLNTSSNIGYIKGLSTMDSGGWGSDSLSVSITAMASWDISENHSLMFAGLWSNGIEYTDDTIYYNNFKNRKATGDYYWAFSGIQLVYNINI